MTTDTSATAGAEVIKPSGGLLTIFEDIELWCNCGERFGAYGANDDKGTEIVTCPKCGQRFKVTCTVEVVPNDH